MLTQVRRWGWLFNPITIYFAWEHDSESPVGAVLEVTNTPWKERRRYATVLEPSDASTEWQLTSRFDKTLHVSPFLDKDFEYCFRVRDDGDALAVALDVARPGSPWTTLAAELRLERIAPTRAVMSRSMLRITASTHRVSLGIHMQALLLWLKRVPVIAHPNRRNAA